MDPPDLILRDEVTNEYWELAFGEEITVTLSPYAVWWRTGIRLNAGWNVRMRRGEIVVSEEWLGEPSVSNQRGDPNFILEVVNGELVYWPLPPLSVVMRDLSLAVESRWWKVTFGREITVEQDVITPDEKTGIKLNQGYEWQVWDGEIRVIRDGSRGPHIWNTQQEWVDLRMVNGESVYRYRDRYVFGQDQFNIAWALFFREEITVYPWEWVTPINGIMLAPESPTWALEMRKGEMVLEENITPPVPYLPRKPDKWRFGLEMNSAGEMVYTPYREADPHQRGEMAA
jgi:hypothetical protein